MRFKTVRIRQEYNDLEMVNPRLAGTIWEIDRRLKREYGKEIYITCIHREPKENEECNGSDVSYHLPIPTCALDFRTETHNRRTGKPWLSVAERTAVKRWFEEGHARHFKDKCLIKGKRMSRDGKRVVRWPHGHMQMEPGMNVEYENEDTDAYIEGVQ